MLDAQEESGIRNFDPMQNAEEECGIRNFDPMQNAEEECGMLGGEARGEMSGETRKGRAVDSAAPFSHPAFKLNSHFLSLFPHSSSAFCIGSKFRIPHSSSAFCIGSNLPTHFLPAG